MAAEEEFSNLGDKFPHFFRISTLLGENLSKLWLHLALQNGT